MWWPFQNSDIVRRNQRVILKMIHNLKLSQSGNLRPFYSNDLYDLEELTHILILLVQLNPLVDLELVVSESADAFLKKGTSAEVTQKKIFNNYV